MKPIVRINSSGVVFDRIPEDQIFDGIIPWVEALRRDGHIRVAMFRDSTAMHSIGSVTQETPGCECCSY